MSASRQPLDADFSNTGTWQSLVRDRGYRLFAAGNGEAVIIEGLPAAPALAPQKLPHSSVVTFDKHYGLRPDALSPEQRFVLLTEVSRAAAGPHALKNGARPSGTPGLAPWKAERSIHPLTSLASFVAKRAGDLVFFLVRSARPDTPLAAAQNPRVDASAVQIGKSLGLRQADLEALRVAGLVCELGKAHLEKTSGAADFSAAGEEGKQAFACQVPGCGNAPTVVLETRRLCRDHFIVRCYEQLDCCSEQLSQRPACEQESEAMRAFLRACIEQAAALTRAPFHQDPLERARLLDIRYTASDLLRKMRRSARVAEARPVLLFCETPGRPWKEALRTVLISRFGLMFECAHFVRPEDWLVVERLDTGARARARMAWRAPAKAGHFSVALEFLDTDNFWGLNWQERPAPASLPS